MSYMIEAVVDGTIRRWPLQPGTTLVGRSQESAVRLSDKAVSSRHAEIRLDGDTLLIEDLGSRNGTYVNGAPANGPVSLFHGSTVRLGNTELRVFTAEARREEDPALPLPSFVPHEDLVSRSISLDEVRRSLQKTAGGQNILFRALAEAGEILVAPKPLDSVLDSILDLVSRAIPSRRILLVLKDSPDAAPVVAASRPAGYSGSNLLLSQTLMNAVLTEAQSLLISDAMADPRFQGSESIIAQQVRSALVAPLHDNEKVLGLLYADSNTLVIRYGEDELRAFTLLAQLIAMKITNTRLLEAEREQERLKQEMATAARIQANLLPKEMPAIPGYEIAARQIPCEAVGGDLYDVLRAEGGGVSLVLGDVSGKGIGAALLMSHLMACIRTLHDEPIDPVRLVHKVHTQLLQSSEASRYATMVYARLDPERHVLTYINAGHVQPLLAHPDGTVETLESTGMPVGLLAGATFESRTIEIRPGATLIICSDGITEAEDADGDLFGEERFVEAVRGKGQEGAAAVLEHVLMKVQEFAGGIAISDDTTLLVLSRPLR